MAAPEVVEALLVVREPFCTNSVAQAAATAALGDADHVRRSRELNPPRRPASPTPSASAATPCCRASATSSPSTPAEDGRALFHRLLARGVIVRPLDPYGMPRWLRVSIGTPEENTAFLEALEAVSERTES